MRLLRTTLAVAVTVLVFAIPARAQPVTWTGAGDGVSWNQAANWSPAALPGATNDVTIPAGATAVSVNVGASIRSLTLNRSVTIEGCNVLAITNGIAFSTAAGVLTTGPFGCESLRLTGTQSITGPGTISCRAGSVHIFGGGTVVTVGTGVAIANDPAATGSVTLDAGTTLNNSGTFRGTAASRTLDVSGTATSAFNNLAGGVTEAVAGGTMSITTTPWTNTGTFNINAGTLRLGGSSTALGAVTRVGGTLELFGTFNGPTLTSTSATGVINLFNGFSSTGTSLGASGGGSFLVTGSCSLTGVTLAAPLSISSSACGLLSISGGLTFGAGGSITTGNIGCEHLRFVGTQSVSGTGSINLGSSSTSIQSGTLTFGPGVTLSSNGAANATFGFNAGTTLVNEGTIMISSGSLAIGSAGATFTNAPGATLGAQTGGTLTLNGVNWSNAGTISVNAGTVTLGGASSSLGTITRTGGSLNLTAVFTGGTIAATPATGTINFFNGASLNGTLLTATGGQSFTCSGALTLNAVTLSAPFQISSSACGLVTVTGGLTFTPGGSITTGNIGCEHLRFSGTQTVDGPGTIGIGTAPATVAGALTIGTQVLLTNAAASPCAFALNPGASVTNNGTVRASGGSLTISGTAPATFTNSPTGTLAALTGGILTVSDVTWTNTGNVTINGGTLTMNGTGNGLGTVTRTGGAYTLGCTYTSPTLAISATTGSVNLTNGFNAVGTTISASGGSTFAVIGSITLNGATLAAPIAGTNTACSLTNVINGLTFAAGGSLSTGNIGCEQLRFTGTQTIGGTGSVSIGTAPATIVSGVVTFGAGVTFANAAGVNGTVGLSGGAGIINQGTMRASGNVLSFTGSPGTSITNAPGGTLGAQSSGTLSIADVNWTNNGTLLVNNATVNLAGTGNALGNVNRTGGTLTLSGSYTGPTLALTAATGSVSLSSGFTITGSTLTATGGSSFLVTGSALFNSVTLGAALTLPSNTCGLLTVTGGLTFVPGGSITTGNIGCEHLRLSGTQTIGGTGSIILGTAAATVAAGTVTLGPSVTLTNAAGANASLAVADGAQLINQGLMLASGAARSLTIVNNATGTLVNQGSLEARNGGTFIDNLPTTNNGFIRAGTNGTFTVSSGRTLTNTAAGTIEIEGTGPSATNDFGHIRVAGTLAAGGTIAVSYPNGLIPGCLIGVNILGTLPGGAITGTFANRVGPVKPAPFASLIAISGGNYFFTSTNQADVGSAGGVAQPDGILDNNDFIVYIDLFFATNPIADRGTTGGIPGTDGVFDNNDFIVYIDQFFAGCG